MLDHKYNKTNSDHCGEFIIVGQDINKIRKLKRKLGKPFAMKDLKLDYQILRMKITRDRESKKLWLPQDKYRKRP